ncbi:MAG: MBL fold metallo-hydrolase [Clostridiales bacterium]|nr:MBL fold metallo-hydrolase [Clostridiales bacterium]
MRINRLVVGPVSTNCYIVSNEETKETFIIDPGEEAERIEQKLQEEQLNLKAILLTHGHFDHMMAVNELLEKHQVEVYIGENEEELLGDPYQNCSGSMMNRPYITKANKTLKDNDVLELAGMTIKVLYTPGHTGGGVCYYLEAENVLFSGDTVFCQSVGRSDLPTGNGRVLQESIRKKIVPLPEDMQIFPGHGDSTILSYEKKYNPYF